MPNTSHPSLSQAAVIIAASEADADLFYATRFLAPDPFTFIQVGKKKIIIASDLEIDRAKDQSAATHVLSTSHIYRALKKKNSSPIGTVDIAAHVLREHGVTHFTVPATFPIAYADQFRKRGFSVEWKREPFYENRAIKSKSEIQWITDALRHTENAIRKAEELLRQSNVRGHFLIYKGKKVTSEMLKLVINVSLMESNCIATHTIISCADDCVDPHNQGSGPILAHQSIVMDVFPHSSETRYFADITRTFVRGKASPKLKAIYNTVKEGQNIAFRQIRSGADGGKIHNDIVKYFDSLGYKTGEIKGRMQGFFHGTGHGVGIEIHEAPRIGGVKDILRENQVVTVEPGLYYLGIGGVRLEDMVVVKKNGCVNLTKYPKILEI